MFFPCVIQKDTLLDHVIYFTLNSFPNPGIIFRKIRYVTYVSPYPNCAIWYLQFHHTFTNDKFHEDKHLNDKHMKCSNTQNFTFHK